MRAFAQLFMALDATTSLAAKTAALAVHFRTAPEADRVWTVALLSGRRPKRAATTTELRQWAAEAAGVPPWLFDECHAVTGDLAETIALILPVVAVAPEASPGLAETIGGLARLPGQPAELRRAAVLAAWAGLPPVERFLFIKLLTGGFRMTVSRGLMTRALAEASGLDSAALAHRLMGKWDPAKTSFADLLAGADGAEARPYPFALAAPLDEAPETLGPPGDWLAEWKWDGIRGQLIARPGAFALWSRGEELITDRFPEFAPLADVLPAGTVIDGEVLAWDAAQDHPLPVATLQRRIGRKAVPKTVLRDAPARFLAFDLLEEAGADLRALPLRDRRARLEHLLSRLPQGLPLAASALVPFADWAGLAALRDAARDRGAEGLMLKSGASGYGTGRKRGDWWKWMPDPFTVDAVMIYAQAGRGQRAGLYADFTFAVRDGDALVPVARAGSGLTDAEFAEIASWVQAHTLERFGPVRQVPPELVFEIAFEGIQDSPRHKAGVALRVPRILRWQRDKPVAEIDTVQGLRALLGPDRGRAPPPDPPRSI